MLDVGEKDKNHYVDFLSSVTSKDGSYAENARERILQLYDGHVTAVGIVGCHAIAIGHAR